MEYMNGPKQEKIYTLQKCEFIVRSLELLNKTYSIFTLVLIPKEYLGAASLTSLSAPSGLYAPGAGVTNCFGSLGLMWSEGATGSSLPKNLHK